MAVDLRTRVVSVSPTELRDSDSDGGEGYTSNNNYIDGIIT